MADNVTLTIHRTENEGYERNEENENSEPDSSTFASAIIESILSLIGNAALILSRKYQLMMASHRRAQRQEQ